jgi:hypothetical protein
VWGEEFTLYRYPLHHCPLSWSITHSHAHAQYATVRCRPRAATPTCKWPSGSVHRLSVLLLCADAKYFFSFSLSLFPSDHRTGT